MAISRAQMRSQLKGGTMKKKPVKKMMLGGILAAKAMDKGMVPLMGVLPMMYNASKNRDNKAAESAAAAAAEAAKKQKEKQVAAARMATAAMKPRGMKAGGKVSRGDGCATRGKTKGRFV